MPAELNPDQKSNRIQNGYLRILKMVEEYLNPTGVFNLNPDFPCFLGFLRIL